MKKVFCMGLAVLFISSCSTSNKNSQKQVSPTVKVEDKTPFLTTPKVRKVWVPEKIDGDKFIEGHWMWVLERTTTWSQ